MSARFVSFKTITAPPIEAGGSTITPVARVLRVNWRRGVAVRAWPCAVLVSRDGRITQHRIPNVTRAIEAIILGSALLAMWRLLHQPSHRKESSP